MYEQNDLLGFTFCVENNFADCEVELEAELGDPGALFRGRNRLGAISLGRSTAPSLQKDRKRVGVVRHAWRALGGCA